MATLKPNEAIDQNPDTDAPQPEIALNNNPDAGTDGVQNSGKSDSENERLERTERDDPINISSGEDVDVDEGNDNADDLGTTPGTSPL